MKHIWRSVITCCCFLLIGLLAFAQQNQTIVLNNLQQKTEELTRNIYEYPQFVSGTIVFMDSTVGTAKLNYHRLLGQMHFINTKGDTMAFAHPETMKMIITGNDTFFFYQHGYLKQLTHHAIVNLFVKETIKCIGKEKKGAYGTYSTLSSASSNNTVTTDDNITTYIQPDENLLFTPNNEFFLSDKFDNFFPATKKGFYSFFSKRSAELKEYLAAHSVSFRKKQEIKKLLEYMNNLK